MISGNDHFFAFSLHFFETHPPPRLRNKDNQLIPGGAFMDLFASMGWVSVAKSEGSYFSGPAWSLRKVLANANKTFQNFHLQK